MALQVWNPFHEQNVGRYAGMQKGPPRAPAQPRVERGPQPSRKMKAFFWDKLPDSRVEGTFWAANSPAYDSLRTSEVCGALGRLLCTLQCSRLCFPKKQNTKH